MGLDHEGSYKMMTSLESKTQMHSFRRCPEESKPPQESPTVQLKLLTDYPTPSLFILWFGSFMKYLFFSAGTSQRDAVISHSGKLTRKVGNYTWHNNRKYNPVKEPNIKPLQWRKCQELLTVTSYVWPSEVLEGKGRQAGTGKNLGGRLLYAPRTRLIGQEFSLALDSFAKWYTRCKLSETHWSVLPQRHSQKDHYFYLAPVFMGTWFKRDELWKGKEGGFSVSFHHLMHWFLVWATYLVAW